MVVQARKPLPWTSAWTPVPFAAATWGWGASLFPACFSFCLTDSGDETTTEAHRRIASEPSQMQGCDKRNRRDSGLPRELVGSRIAVDGPELCLNAAAAQAIGLVLHELATNAGKYGALSVDTGRVEVSWGSDDDTFTMSWTECEGPPVSAPERRGFGTIVIKAMAERSVDGAVDLDYAPSGLTWRLTCAAASALELVGDREQFHAQLANTR